MNFYKADIHIHTMLSPCGDDGMTPIHIVHEAVEKQLDFIGITDHNAVRHGPVVKRIAAEYGIFVLCGAEVTTREEVHCLVFFENELVLNDFAEYIYRYLVKIPNHPGIYGNQLVVDENNQVVENLKYLLVMAIDQGILEVERKVHDLGGLFIPAHINRPINGLLAQMGSFPAGLNYDALELYRNTAVESITSLFPQTTGATFLRNSDAHLPGSIAQRYTRFCMNEISFSEIRLALLHENGRFCSID